MTESIQDRLDQMKKKRRQRRKVSFFVLVLSFIIVFGFGQMVSLIREASGLGPISIERIKTVSAAAAPTYKKQSFFYPVVSGVIMTGNERLTYMTAAGEVVWEKEFFGSDILAHERNEKFYICDKATGDFYVLDKKGQILSKIEGLGRVDRFVVGSDGYTALYLKNDKKIALINPQGIVSASIPVPYEDLLDVRYSESMGLIALSVLVVENDYFHTNVLLFGTDGKMRGARNFNHTVVFRLSDAGQDFIGYSDELMIAFNDQNEEIWKKIVDRTISKLEFDQQGNTLLNLTIKNRAIDDTREDNVLSLYNSAGDRLFERKMDVVIDVLSLGPERIAFVGDGKLHVLNFSGKLLGARTIDDSLTALEWLDQNHLGVEYENRYEIYTCSY
jgi:hypothetical protein